MILNSRDEMLRGLSADQQQYLTDILQAVRANLSNALEMGQSHADTGKFDDVPV